MSMFFQQQQTANRKKRKNLNRKIQHTYTHANNSLMYLCMKYVATICEICTFFVSSFFLKVKTLAIHFGYTVRAIPKKNNNNLNCDLSENKTLKGATMREKERGREKKVLQYCTVQCIFYC